MTDQLVAMWLAMMMVVEAAAIVALFYLGLSGKTQKMHWMVIVSALMLAFGLGVQIIRSIHYFQFGSYPVDKYFPLWIFKDLGGALYIFYLAFYWDKQK